MARDETIKLSLIDGVTRTLASIQQGVSGVGAQLSKLNQTAELASKGFAAIGAAASAVGDAVQGAADLESALALVQARTGATAAEMRALDGAIQSALASGTADEGTIVDVLTQLTREGLSAAQSSQQLGTVLAFAAANGANATQSVGSLLDVLGGFNRPAEDIGNLADKLTALSQATGTPVEALQKGLAGVAVQADAAGLSLDQTLLLIGGLSTRAIEGGRASAQLGKAIAELSDPASKAGEALAEVGGNSADLMASLKLLEGNSRAAEQVLSQLGAKPRAAMQALLADGGAALDALRTKLDGAAGASQAASDAIGSTFNRAVQQLQNAVANLRNEFLSPILQPLAAQAGELAEKLNGLADSPGFARLRDQFATLATGAIQSIGDLIERADLEQWAADAAEFAGDVRVTFDALVTAVRATAGAIRGIGEAIDYLRQRAAELDAYFSDSTESVNRFNVATRDGEQRARKWAGELDNAGKKAKAAGVAAKEAGAGAQDFAGAADDASQAAGDLADNLGPVPPAAKLIVGTLQDAAGAADISTLSLEALQKRLAAVRAELAQAAPGSTQFEALAREAATLEQQIAATNAQIDAAGKALQQTDDRARSAAGGLREFGSAARDAGDAAGECADRNSQVSDSFGNIGNQSSETAISLGTLSEAFVRQALEAAGAAKSAKDYIDTLNRFFVAGADQEEKIKARLEVLNRQNAALSEEEQIRRRLALQYGTSSTLLDELVRKELELAHAKKQANDEAERGIEIEQRRNAGGVNFGQPAAPSAQPPATRGRSGAADAQIVVNVQGAPTDAAGWRDIVSRFVIPELERVQRLSR